ncbi:hypothetical protein [uncultured Oscillibacter sp.]|uniref:hypothetical protein n=1 Tax=uncultured Oscillibacter sp. TaxID=876091 RepID=UPI0025CC0A3E|nr:hypothetical protein [uncultured Oscillibacter sp.]
MVYKFPQFTRALALTLAAVLPATLIPVGAAEKIGDGVAPTYDEAYYATLDYYGNLTEGSVVKSYALNGATALTDYGTYDEVVNLTDGTAPTEKDNVTTFDFSKAAAPSHFYFEGKTTAPFAALPWTIALSYTLNGVPTKAEDLAGKTGVVNINLDIIPNESASDYAKNNYTLEAMALFNQDDILSLKAKGAQVQLVGNLRTVLFLALPGEEQHFTIEVGSDDFSFGGMTFMMLPATLAQLDQIAELSDRKDELEDDYEKLNNSLDTTLDALNSMTGSLYSSAKGLDALNKARGTISAGKGSIYDGIDVSKLDMESIAALLDPVAEQVQAASETLTKSKDILKTMSDTTVSLKTELAQTKNALNNLEKSSGDLRDLTIEIKRLSGNLERLRNALNDMDSIPSVSSPLAGYGDIAVLRQARDTVVTLNTAYQAATSANPPAFSGTFEEFVLAQVGGDQETCQKLLAVYAKRQQMGADSFDFLLDNSGSVDAVLDALNGTTSEVNSTLSGIAGPTADVVSRLAYICDKMGALYNLLDNVEDLAHIGQSATDKADTLLGKVGELQTLLSSYEPKAQESLKTLEDLSVTAAGSIRNAEKLISDTEALARTSGEQLDAGTKQTLEGLAASLRQTAAALATSKDIKSAKNSLDSIITDTWNEHTGDVDNLLNMDSTAPAQSLTSGQNPSPQSIQILIRSQEIKVPDEDEEETASAAADKGSFGSRVGQMFHDLWSSITGIFH